MKNKWKVCIATALAAITSVAVCANVKANAEDKKDDKMYYPKELD